MASEIKYLDIGRAREGRLFDVEALLDDAYQDASSIYEDEKESLEWLRGVEVYSLRRTIQRYSINGAEGQFTIPALVHIAPNRAGLLLPDSAPKIGRSVTEMMAAWAVGAGFPREKESNLAETLSILYQNAEEASAQEEEGPQIPGYTETKATLAGWYTGCQICGSVTPQSEDGGLTLETLRSIISNRGGVLPGKLERYEVGNSLYLCPRHHVLMERRLVKLDFLDDAEKDRDGLRKRISKALSLLGEDEDQPINCRVFEGNVQEKQPTGWRTKPLTLRKEHAKALYEKLLDYLDHAR